MKIVLATHNRDKFLEMKAILSSYSIEIFSLDSFPIIGQIIENGNTLQENALIKAKTVYEKTGFYSWADDTGLEVDYLNGDPGIYSSRYAGNKCKYIDNVNKLLTNMKGVPTNKRSAYFKTSIAFIGNNMELTTTGTVKGYITKEPKGVGGFGYDSVFYVPEKSKTYSEMKLIEKNKISHRSKAITEMIELLQPLFPKNFQQMEDVA
tara:strand:+ start:226 stop:846 length:621 start_codon:yes stop_codon:yes gene_type:complete